MTKNGKRSAAMAGSNSAPMAQDNLAKKMDALLKRLPKGTFAKAGGAIGSLAGPKGSAMGGVLGSGLAAITGYGDYQVNSNTISTIGTSVDSVPQFVRNDHSVRVRHREFVRDLVVPAVPAGFTNSSTPINPSNSALFPWLASLAKQYQTYKFHGMVVEYKTMSSDYAASGPLGTVVIATNYNVNDPSYANKVSMENSEFAVSCKPSMSIVHAIECDPKLRVTDFLYVRDAASSSVSDNRLFDLGSLQIATSGLPGSAGVTLGEVWVSYDIEFAKPIIPYSADVNANVLVSQSDGSTAVNSNGNVQTVSVVLPYVTTSGTGTNSLWAIPDSFTFTNDLWGPGKPVYFDGDRITLQRPGIYRVRYIATLRGNITGGDKVCGPVTGYTDNAPTPAGSPAFTKLFGYSFLHQLLYNSTAAGKGTGYFENIFVVTSADTDNYIIVPPPTFAAQPGGQSNHNVSIDIAWYDTKVTPASP
jgi:hypothetical protein